MIHIELLKSFLELGSPFSKLQLNSLLLAVFILYLAVSTGIYRFLPFLGRNPPDEVVAYYNTLQTIFVGVIITLETLVLFHLVQLIVKFTKDKRIHSYYTPVQVRRIIWIGILGNAGSWVAIAIYVTKVNQTYDGYCWANIAGAFGMSTGIAVPFIFHILSCKNHNAVADELITQFNAQPEIGASMSFSMTSVRGPEVQQEAHGLTLLDSPRETPTVSQYTNVLLRMTPSSSRKPSPMNPSGAQSKMIRFEQKINVYEQ
jgi:uncharacterized membrane protein (DUF485 family)